MTRPLKTTIFSAPGGWGKSRRAEELLAEFGCKKLIDPWELHKKLTPNALHLTNCPPKQLKDFSNLPNVRLVLRGWP